MNKRIGILILVLFVIVIGWVVAKRINFCSEELVSIPVSEKDSKLQIGEKIVERYLEIHKQGKKCFCGWIRNYQIYEIQTNGFHQDGEHSFVTTVSFSVKPVLEWNWVKNQMMFVIITKDNKLYKLQGIVPKRS